MTGTVVPMRQHDEALRLLAQMYARWCAQAYTQGMQDIYARIREVLYTASSQQQAHEQCVQLVQEALSASHSDERRCYEQIRDVLAELIAQGGQAESLIVGQTDGYRHLCQRCCEDEHVFQQIPFFHLSERRFLLRPEVEGIRRSPYARCQRCEQPIAPTMVVLCTFAGTQRHPQGCQCGACNRAKVGYVLTLYACDKETQQVLLPALHQVVAPSRRQGVEQAVTVCWERGWHLLNKDTLLP